MKTCPICLSGAFDDALVCYGCLHRFEEGENIVIPRGAAEAEESAGAIRIPFNSGAGSLGGAPALIISVQAVQGGQGGVEWRCDMDGRTASGPSPSDDFHVLPIR